MSVCCPSLENQLALLGEHWLNNNSKINNEVQRLEAILKHWTRLGMLFLQSLKNNNNNINTRTSVTKDLWFSTRYQRECAELSQWLQSALERLEFWNTQAILVPQELETVREHLSAFLVRQVSLQSIQFESALFMRTSVPV